jgi:hypothetical protein
MTFYCADWHRPAAAAVQQLCSMRYYRNDCVPPIHYGYDGMRAEVHLQQLVAVLCYCIVDRVMCVTDTRDLCCYHMALPGACLHSLQRAHGGQPQAAVRMCTATACVLVVASVALL